MHMNQDEQLLNSSHTHTHMSLTVNNLLHHVGVGNMLSEKAAYRKE